MSDLEQSNIENMNNGDGSVDAIENSSAPTFTSNNNTATQEPDNDDATNDDVNNDDTNNNDANEEENDQDSQNDEDEDDDDDDASIINSDDEAEDDDANDDISIDEETGIINKKTKAIVKKPSNSVNETPTTTLDIPVEFEKHDSDYESDDDEEEDDEYLQKFDREMRDNYILDQHPESVNHNYDEIYNLAKVQRNKENIVIDDLHKTIPLLTKYEKTRILGQRAKQLNNGARPLVKLDIPLIDGYLIALKELEEKMIPVIIRRPLPSGASEYWHLKDLEIL